MTDVELVQAVLNGDRGQYARLVERYQRDIYNVAYRSTNNRHDAEDVAQETFLRAFRGLSEYDQTRSLRTWLYAIAVNVCRDRARRAGSRPQSVPLLESDGPAEPASGPPQPQDVVVKREMQDAVQNAVMALDPDHRLPVILFYMRGVSQADVADIMGVPLTVVKNRLYRARRRMREALTTVLHDENAGEGR